MPDDGANLYSHFLRAFPDDPDQAFLQVPDEADVGFVALDGQIGSYHTALDQLGVRRGDRVVAQIEKSPGAVLLYLACLRAGAVFVPLNPAYTASEVQRFVADAEPALVVADPDQPRVREAADAAFATMDRHGNGELADLAGGSPPDRPVTAVEPDAVATILYTSGTTGRSKGAMLTHRNLLANAEALHQAWRFEPGDILLHALPLFHAHGLFVALHCALLNGSTVILLPRFDPDAVVRWLPSATVFMGVPTHYTRLLGHSGFDRAACAPMRLMTSGSAPLSAATWHHVRERTGHEVVERYGMSEALMITSNPYGGERRAGTVGFALPQTEVRIVDDRHVDVPPGTTGILVVRSPSVSPGYWRTPEATTASRTADGFLISGDLASQDGDGRVTIHGRASDLVITGGLNVYPAEVERVLDDIDGVVESAVVGVPHPDYGEAVTAVMVLRPGAAVTAPAVEEALRAELAPFKHPKATVVIEALPRNTMGKVVKHELRSRLSGIYETAADPTLRFLSHPPDTVGA